MKGSSSWAVCNNMLRGDQKAMVPSLYYYAVCSTSYVRGVTGMGHPYRQHWESGPHSTTNQFIHCHNDIKLAPVGWATLPPAECLL